MHLKSLNAPAINEEGIKRLYSFARPKKLTSNSTLFDAGYEQCKADLLERLQAEVGRPNDELAKISPRSAAEQNAHQTHIPKRKWRLLV